MPTQEQFIEASLSAVAPTGVTDVCHLQRGLVETVLNLLSVVP